MPPKGAAKTPKGSKQADDDEEVGTVNQIKGARSRVALSSCIACTRAPPRASGAVSLCGGAVSLCRGAVSLDESPPTVRHILCEKLSKVNEALREIQGYTVRRRRG